MPENLLTMSKKEIKRIKVLEQIESKKLNLEEGSPLLNLSERQTYRIIKRYREEGTNVLVHRSRGKPSNRGYPEELKEKVIRIYRKRYKDFGATFFTEKLEKNENV